MSKGNGKGKSDEIETMAELETRLIRKALAKFGDDKAALLAALGISSRELTRLANLYRIDLPWKSKRH